MPNGKCTTALCQKSSRKIPHLLSPLLFLLRAAIQLGPGADLAEVLIQDNLQYN